MSKDFEDVKARAMQTFQTKTTQILWSEHLGIFKGQQGISIAEGKGEGKAGYEV